MAGLYKTKKYGYLIDDHGNPIVDIEEKIATWMDVEKLFEDDRHDNPVNVEFNTSLPITIDDVRIRINNIIYDKSTAPNNFCAEFLNIMNDTGSKWLTSILNNVYNIGKISQN